MDVSSFNVVVTFNKATGGKSYGSYGGSGEGAGAFLIYTNLWSSGDTFSNNMAAGGYGADMTATGGGGFGGGIYETYASAILVGDHLDNNWVLFGGSLNPANGTNRSNSAHGAGLLNGSGASLELDGTSVSSNTASGGDPSLMNSTEAGGIYNASGATANLYFSSLRGNTALGPYGEGGGAWTDGTFNLKSNSLITQNSAPGSNGKGGGLFKDGGTTLIFPGSAVTGNIAGGYGNNCYPAIGPCN